MYCAIKDVSMLVLSMDGPPTCQPLNTPLPVVLIETIVGIVRCVDTLVVAAAVVS